MKHRKRYKFQIQTRYIENRNGVIVRYWKTVKLSKDERYWQHDLQYFRTHYAGFWRAVRVEITENRKVLK